MVLLTAAPVCAQTSATATAEEAFAAAEALYGPPPPKKTCPPIRSGEEIVVCAEQQEQSQFRIRSDEQAEDDYARATMDKGAPRAPDVAGPGIFKGPATMSFGNPPPPVYMIDFAALPPTPPGSDAERVGQGLAPRGNDPARGTLEPLSSPGSASPTEPQ